MCIHMIRITRSWMRTGTGGSLLSLRPELLCDFLLPCVFAIERWVPEFEQSREPHGVGALLIPLPTIQTTITREEIRERTN